MQTIEQMYLEKTTTPSDINELLPYLKKYALKCSHITEMGVRNPTSTYAFLAAKPEKLISYDISRYPEVALVEELAVIEQIDFKFVLADVLQVEIEPTEFLFIDTFHTATQLERELALHAHKVSKYIGFHDTTTFWETGEPSYESVSDKGTNCGRGLKYALEPFLESHPEWQLEFREMKNNGLTIIKRVA